MRFTTTLSLSILLGGCALLPAAAATLNVPSATYPTIQSALNAAKTGDTVQVSPKTGSDPTYHENLTMSTAGVTLQGINGATLDGTGTSFQASPFGNGFFTYQFDAILIEANNVQVNGLKIQNYLYQLDLSIPSTSIFVSGVHVQGGVQNCQIIGNTFNLTYNGIQLEPGTQSHMVNNTITNCGIGILGTSISKTVVEHNTLLNNKNISDGYGNSTPGDGISLDGGGIDIHENEVGFSSNGVFVGNSAPITGSNSVEHNKVHDSVFDGIAVGNGGTTDASHNVVTGNGVGIHLTNAFGATISHNEVTNSIGHTASGGLQANPGDGIDIEGFSSVAFPSNNLISHNEVYNNLGIGIHVIAQNQYGLISGSEGNTLEHNESEGNTVFDAQDDTFDGTQVYNTWSHNDFGTANPPSIGAK